MVSVKRAIQQVLMHLGNCLLIAAYWWAQPIHLLRRGVDLLERAFCDHQFKKESEMHLECIHCAEILVKCFPCEPREECPSCPFRN